MLAHLVCIIRRRTSKKLRYDITRKARCVQVALHQHSQRYCRVHMASTDATDEEHNKRQCTTDDEWVTAAGENRQNEEKCTNVLGQVGCVG